MGDFPRPIAHVAVPCAKIIYIRMDVYEYQDYVKAVQARSEALCREPAGAAFVPSIGKV